MAKKKQVELLNKEQEGQVLAAGTQVNDAIDSIPTPRRFTPKDCPMCESHRPKGLSFSRVYSTQGRIRYCRCEFCRHTWSQEGQ